MSCQHSASKFVVVLICVAELFLLLDRPTSGRACAHDEEPVASDADDDETGSTRVRREVASGCPCPGGANASQVSRMDVIKNDILRKLRMLQPPNSTSQPRRLPEIPPLREIMETATVETAERESRREFYDDHATTMSILAISQPLPPGDRSPDLDNTIQFKFNMSGIDPDDVISGQLGVFVRDLYPQLQRQTTSSTTYVVVSLVRWRRLPDGGKTYYQIPMRRRAVPTLATGQGRWMQFEIRDKVREWLRQTSSEESEDSAAGEPAVVGMLRVETRNDKDTEPVVEIILAPQRPSDQTLKPYIEIKVRESSTRRRRKRSMPVDLDCDSSSAETRCCRYPLTVDFREFGWDWVLAPLRYEAFYCSGACPFTYYQAHTNTHLVHQSLPPTGTPCCAPTAMGSLPLVHMESNGGIVYSTLPGMVVERCGCA